MLSNVLSYGLMGLDGYPVTIEVDASGGGVPFFEIVGLPDAAVKESKERVRAALRNSGFAFPDGRVTLNMAPADVRKEGPIYDLPIAMALLAVSGRVSTDSLKGMVLLGELSLDGQVRGIRGALPMVLAARENGMARAALPAANAAELSCVEGMEIFAVSNLRELATALNSKKLQSLPMKPWRPVEEEGAEGSDDISRIKGQYGAKRALEVAAAGGHNLLMV